jgi:DNA-binding MarR family transcriptional regulator
MNITKTVTEHDLQEQMIALVRAFGLHRPDQTPCGKPVAVAEAHALIELSREQPLSQSELAARLRLEKSTISRLVGQLEGRGWLERRRNQTDGRVIDLWLTQAGQNAAVELSVARRAKFAHILAAIPEERRDEVIEALHILVEAIRDNS